jgi:hypothetical protein
MYTGSTTTATYTVYTFTGQEAKSVNSICNSCRISTHIVPVHDHNNVAIIIILIVYYGLI